MSERKDGTINRRDFFRSVSKAALPTIAFLGLALPGPAAGRTSSGSGGADPAARQRTVRVRKHLRRHLQRHLRRHLPGPLQG